PIDAFLALEVEVGDLLAIADRADYRQHLALGDMGERSYRLDALDDGVNLLLRRVLFHNDHHGCLSFSTSELPILVLGLTALDPLRVGASRAKLGRPPS